MKTIDEIAVQIKIIEYNSVEYSKELTLRDDVLRKPLGMNLFDEDLSTEIYDFHLGAFSNSSLTGVLILTKLNFRELKMRQVAVDYNHQSLKIGSRLVFFAEKYAAENGFTSIVLNARKTAVEFYEKLGYEKISDEFLEINIPHYKMRKYI